MSESDGNRTPDVNIPATENRSEADIFIPLCII
jgi:hypothetical protein